jgi:uncharacterized repeat protein (TIGR01451 family)
MFLEFNRSSVTRNITHILLYAFLICCLGISSQATPQKGKQSARSTRAKSASASKRTSVKRAKRNQPVSRRGNSILKRTEAEQEPTDKPDEAVRAELEKRLPPGSKELPVERYFEAKEKIKQMQRYSTAQGQVLASEAETGQSDTELLQSAPGASLSAGSTSGVLGTWLSLGPGNVGGRTRALIIDPVSPDTMYAAGVAGGIWKSTNGGASWAPLDDFMANIAVTCLVFEPGNTNVIYAGTGEGFFNADAVQGAGIFKSTDAGATWTRLSSTNTVDFRFVNDIVVGNGTNSQHVYAATRTGVWRSLDGGATWAMIMNVPTVAGSATGVRGAMDIAIRTDQATDYIFVAAGTGFATGEPQSHIYRSTDAATASVVPTGTTAAAGSFTDVYTETNMGRTSLAIAPSNQNVIYALSDSIEAGQFLLGLLGVFRSTSSGDPGSWTTQVRNTTTNRQDASLLSNPINFVLLQCGQSTSNNILNQGWYDNVIAVDPTDSDKVWVGGTDLFRSDNGGVNWGVASYWWFTSNGTVPPANADTPQYAHADQHAIVFHPNYNGTTNQTMFVGNDGGIFKTDNAKVGNVGYTTGTTPSATTVTPASPICGGPTPGQGDVFPNPVYWSSLNNGYAVTQFWPGTVYPDGTKYMGGTQDNGTNRGTDATGTNQWERINGGDGGYSAVDFNNTQVLYSENTGNTFQKSTNGGASWSAARSGISGDTFPFTSVFRMDPNNSARVWYAGRFMWRTDNSAVNWTRTSDAAQTGGSITAMAIAPGDSNKVINGAASGQLRRTTTATTLTSTSVLNSVWLQSFTPRGNGGGGISWVEYDPSNTNTVWATVSNFNSASSGVGFGHVFKSTDGGATWTLADGNQTPGNVNSIPDIPVWSVAVDPNNSQRIYVGTDLGVFVTLDGGANWAKETTGFSNTVVKSLTVLNISGVSTMYAFTHGRGAFKVSIPASCASVPANVAVGAGGGATNVSVTSAAGACTWNAVSNDSWIHVTGGASGAGSGTVNLNIDENETGTPRTGTLTVAGQTVSIFQRANATLSWSHPADITYGTALSGTQLNAMSNIPGTFNYTPTAGTVLGKGSHILQASFTPTDTTNYDPSGIGTSINVLSAVLNVSMIADRNPAAVELNLNYNATITNTGDASATNTVLTDVLPLGVTYTASSPSQGTCSYNSVTRTVSCNLGTIAAAGSATVQITVKPRNEGTLNNTATITASQWDPATGNSSASVNGLPAQKFVDLAVQMSGSANPIFAGQNVTYTVTVKNVGTPFGASGVVLTDTLPASMNFVSATTSQGSLVTPPVGSTGIVTANLGSIAAGATATVTITVSSTTPGVVTNSATATSTENDSSNANNTGSASTTVNPAGLQKVLLASQVLIGGCQNTTGNVYLTGPAGPGGVTVPLSTSNLAGVTVPASVFIPAGQMVSPAFNVTTTPVVAKQVGLVTAGSGQNTVSRGLTINVGSGACPP